LVSLRTELIEVNAYNLIVEFVVSSNTTGQIVTAMNNGTAG
jgi:hypothetical protein